MNLLYYAQKKVDHLFMKKTKSMDLIKDLKKRMITEKGAKKCN